MSVPALVVINDFFDTYEKMQILFSDLCEKYYGCQILVFNYPGQFETKFRNSDSKNSIY